MTADSARGKLSDLLHVRVWSIHVSQLRSTSTDALDKLVSHSLSLSVSVSLAGSQLTQLAGDKASATVL